MHLYENIEWKQERIKSTKELTDKVSIFLDFLTENSVKYPEILSLNNNYVIFNQFTLSLEQTFSNVKTMLLNGNYSNSFALLRQFRDDFLLYLVMLLDASNRNKNIEVVFSIEEIYNNPIAALNTYEKKIHEHDTLEERQALNKWFQNEETRYSIDYKCYQKYLLGDKDIEKINTKLDFDTKLKQINEILNGFTHSKSVQYFINNVTRTFSKEEIERLNQQFSLVTATIITYVILVLCHVKPIMLTYSFEPEELEFDQPLEYQLDYRTYQLLEKYSDKGIRQYVNEHTVFKNSFDE